MMVALLDMGKGYCFKMIYSAIEFKTEKARNAAKKMDGVEVMS